MHFDSYQTFSTSWWLDAFGGNVTRIFLLGLVPLSWVATFCRFDEIPTCDKRTDERTKYSICMCRRRSLFLPDWHNGLWLLTFTAFPVFVSVQCGRLSWFPLAFDCTLIFHYYFLLTYILPQLAPVNTEYCSCGMVGLNTVLACMQFW